MHKRVPPYAIAGIILVLVGGSTISPAYLPVSARQEQGCREFKETGRFVCGRFLDYWLSHGGLIQQGFPISSEFSEKSEVNGKTYTMQYFERAVFELHLENDAPNDVLLTLVGNLGYKQKYP